MRGPSEVTSPLLEKINSGGSGGILKKHSSVDVGSPEVRFGGKKTKSMFVSAP